MATTHELHFSKLVRSVLAILFTLVALLAPVFAQTVSDEYRLKAAFVLRFPQFVEWPASVLDGRDSVELCVLRPHHFGTTLDDLTNGEEVGGRPLTVREIDSDEQVDTCHVLFLPATDAAWHAVVRRASRLPVLTVSDAPKFLDEGGIVQLRIFQNRVRFDINAVAAERAGLRLSSQLLRLAVTVKSVGQ